MTQLKKLLCLVLFCLLLCGCSSPKGGDIVYGTVTAKMINEVYWPARREYLVNIDVEGGHDIRYGEVDKVTYDNITFGSRVKMIYTGFADNWTITPGTP